MRRKEIGEEKWEEKDRMRRRKEGERDSKERHGR